MAPQWVLLDRMVSFVGSKDAKGSSGGADAAAAGGSSRGGAAAARGSSRGGAAAAAASGSSRGSATAGGGSSRRGATAGGGSSRVVLSPQEAMAAMIPKPMVVAPPKVSRLHMVRQTSARQLGLGVNGGEISSVNGGLVVLYSGSYRPGNGGFSGDGCYLVYDACHNSLSAIPPLPESPTMKGLGRSAVAMFSSATRHCNLVELVTTCNPGLPEAMLCVWFPSSAGDNNPTGKWTQVSIVLPLPAHLCGPKYFFKIDMTLLFGRYIYWVDLLAGVLVCDLRDLYVHCDLPATNLSFIPLPEIAALDITYNLRLRLMPEEFRSMGCVRDKIKFVALIGYSEAAFADNEVMLKTWTLSPGVWAWEEDDALCVGDLWASVRFKEMGLPQAMPMCPVLSMSEDGVVYVILNDVKHVKDVDVFGDVHGVELVPKAHYRLRLDMQRNKVLEMFSTKNKENFTGDLSSLRPTLLASDFNAFLRDPKDHQGGDQPSKIGTRQVKY